MKADFLDYKSYNKIVTHYFWCQHVLPLVYEDSLSYYEVLCKLTKWIGDIIEDLESTEHNIDELKNAYIELENYVNDYFDNVNIKELVDEKVEEVIDLLIENEELERMLVDYFVNPLYEFNPQITGYVKVAKEVPSDMSSPQGFCVINGTVYLGYSSPNNEATSKLIRYNPDGNSAVLTGTFNHLESMCSDGEHIYSLDCLIGTGDNVTYLNTVSVFNISPFEFSHRITINMTGIGGTLTGLMYNDGLYVVTTSGDVYKVNEDYSLTQLCTLRANLTTIQQTYMDAHFIYVAQAYPNLIYIFKHTGELYNVFNIGNNIPNLAPVNEIEGVYIENEIMYIRYRTLGERDMVIACPIGKPVIRNVPAFNSLYVQTLYVDGIENTAERMATNHFKTIQDAVDYTASFDSGKYIINCSIDSTEDVVINNANIAYRFDGSSFSGSFLIRGGNVTLNFTNINCTKARTIYITNSTNIDCTVYVLGQLTGVASNHFIETYGKCKLFVYVTGSTTNNIYLDRHAELYTFTDMPIYKRRGSIVHARGVLSNITGFAGGNGEECAAFPVNVTVTDSEVDLPLPDVDKTSNVNVEIRTADNSKNTFYISTTSGVQIMPFYHVDGSTFNIFYIRMRWDGTNFRVRTVNANGYNPVINLVVLH